MLDEEEEFQQTVLEKFSSGEAKYIGSLDQKVHMGTLTQCSSPADKWVSLGLIQESETKRARWAVGVKWGSLLGTARSAKEALT
ncbi:MAG: hypothetical protein LQ340_002102 [Diploschistes diacapsis]|nr:MAG: hypothetical protein LQ340_002102 [Diploschistes diacapsis]